MQSDLKRITESDYVRLSTLKFSDYVYSKDYVFFGVFRKRAIAISNI